MVLTRSQKTKEEDDIKLAEQQSLVEQVQQVPASQEGQNELEATTATSQNVSQEDVSRNTSEAGVVRRSDAVPPVSTNDVSQVDVVTPNVLESEVSKASKAIVSSVVSVKQDTSEAGHSKQDTSKQDVVQQDAVLHSGSLPHVGQQNDVENLTKPDSRQSTSNDIIVEPTGDQHFGDQRFGDQYSGDQYSGGDHFANEHLSDAPLGNELLNDNHPGYEHLDEDSLDTEHTNAKHADAEHADVEHVDIKHTDVKRTNADYLDSEHSDVENSDNEYSDDEHSDDENSGRKHPSAAHHSKECLNDEHLGDEYLGDEYSNDEHSGDEHSDDEHSGDEHGNGEHSDAENPSDEHVIDEHAGREHPKLEHLSDEHPDNEDFVNEDESDSIKTEAKDTKSINNVKTSLGDATLTVTVEAEYSERYSFRSRVKKTQQSILTKVEESITTLDIIHSPETSESDNDEDDEDVDTSGSDPGDKLTDLSALDDKPTTARHGKKKTNLPSKKAPINKTRLQQNSAVSGLASKKVPSNAGRPGRGVSDNVPASISDSKRSVRARGRTAPKVKGKQYDSADKNTQRKRKSTKISRIDDVDLVIPINPEDEDEFVPEQSIAITTQTSQSLRDRTKFVNYRKEVRVTTRSRTTNLAKAPSSKKSRAANIVKARKSDTQEKHLIFKLSHGKKLVATSKIKIKKPKRNHNRVKVPKGIKFYTNKYRFKFGWSPFVEYPKVHTKTYQEVYNLLAESLAPEGISLNRKSGDEIIIDGVSQGPMHAGEAVTVDVLVKVIMSQATNNENALSAQARLISAFPYSVNGETVVGKTPNYHEVRLEDNKTKLENALAPAGLHVIRSKAIANCLNAIRQKNIDAKSPGYDIDSNPPDVADFVPGSLSLKYLDALSKEEKMDELLDLELVGVKTAMCILAFAYGLPVFAVDTHVHRMVKSLGWVPEDCDRDDAAAHLDHFIPDHLKYGLHQGFWHHGQKCLRCKAKNDPSTKGWEDAVCVLEEYVKRHPKKERKSPERKRKKEVDDGADADSPKPKVRKGNKTMTTKAVSEEEAVANGWVKQEILIEDNFNTAGANFTGRKEMYWIKPIAI